jgi:ribose 5-phosphate isomerase B
MKIALGSDHAGLELKNQIRDQLRNDGHEVVDMGTNTPESTDYPDYARLVGECVALGQAERGILICGSGAGMAIAANKIHGIRAGVGTSPGVVRLLRGHNDINVLAEGARFTSPEDAVEMVRVFLTTPFEGGRHQRRINKIAQMEQAL